MAKIEASVDVEVDVPTAYNQWTQFESFPLFMKQVQSVRQIDERHVHWMAQIGGRLREWNAEIVEQLPDERIVWRSLDGTPNDGDVRFEPLNPVSEPPVTRVTLTMLYDPNDCGSLLSARPWAWRTGECERTSTASRSSSKAVAMRRAAGAARS